MAFRFTEEDFKRYVTKTEHGGVHIWDEVLKGLKEFFGSEFTVNPWKPRGDWLKVMWFFPKNSGRPDWRYQAMFHLRRALDHPRLSFGLVIECPTAASAHADGLDENRDGVRLLEKLASDPQFCQRLNSLVRDEHYRLSVTPWDDSPLVSVQDSDELHKALKGFYDDVGWSASISKSLNPEEAISLGAEAGQTIVAVYQQLADLWMDVIPEADRTFIEEKRTTVVRKGLDRNSEEDARRIIEQLLPDPSSRRDCLNVMADYIVTAHELSSATWAITLFKDRVRLNIGSIQSFVIHPNQVYLVLDETKLTEQDRTELHGHGEPGGQDYASVKNTFDILLPAGQISSVQSMIREAYPTLVARAYKGAKRNPYRSSHSPGVLKYLRSFLGRELPDSDYGENPGTEIPPSSLDLSAILQDLVAAYGLHYTPWQLATFYTALQTKGFVILSGISGTGKTKLAQAFAEALPAASDVLVEVPDDIVALTVKPYMLKYHRVIIPKQAFQLFMPPKRGETKDITIAFEGKKQSCRLTYSDYENTNYLAFYFKGQLTSWFKDTFEEGDTFGLRPELDEEGVLTGFRLHTESDLATVARKQSTTPANLLFVPVRPDWRDSKSLLGYYNPLTGTYQWTPFLRFLVRAAKSYRDGDGLAWFVILDEMNLAHVEYYFADLLSILESGRDNEGWTRESVRFEVPPDAEGDVPPRELRLPPNLYIVGTVNVDETTHSFSPKVLDRGFTLELTDVDLRSYPPASNDSPKTSLSSDVRQALLSAFTRDGQFACIDKTAIADCVSEDPTVRERLSQLNVLLHPYDLHFGYRVFDEIVAFIDHAQDNDLYTQLGGLDAALDAAVLMKVLPKFHGSRGKLESPLIRVLAWCLSPEAPDITSVQEQIKQVESADDVVAALDALVPRYPRTADKTKRMLWSLYASGFATFG